MTYSSCHNHPLNGARYHTQWLDHRWNWIIKSFVKKIYWELPLFCDVVYFSTFCCAFLCILPVFTPWYTIILLLLPTIFYRCCCYTCREYLPSRYVGKNHRDFLVYWISAIFLPIFSNRHRFWGSGSLVVSKWCHYVMVEAESNLKLLPRFILNISKVFECIGVQSTGIH